MNYPTIETRCKKVIIRVTKSEQRRWREQAKRIGKRFSSFVRDTMNEASQEIKA